jgi:hypothetical protein
MANVTNHAQVPLSVHTGKGGDESSVTVQAGETKSIAFDANSKHNQGLIFAGAISVEGQKAAAPSTPRKTAARTSRKTSVPSSPKAEEPKPDEA